MKTRLVTPLVAIAICCLVTSSGWSQRDYSYAQRNLPTREAQKNLVAGLTPVRPKVRFRRELNAPQPATPLRQPAAYDYRNAPEARKSAAELEKVKRNIAKSDWPIEAAYGKERVIYASPEGEQELEYDTAELAALAAKAKPRGINHASGRGGMEKAELETPEFKSLFIPASWSNGIDSRIVKKISATYPINHRVLRRIGELDGEGCSGALVGRRLVLTAAHCIVKPDLSYNEHSFRARRSGSQSPYGTAKSVNYWYASKWVSNDCHLNRTWECSPHDWAILLLEDDAWDSSPNGSPGWMGYWVYGENFIRDNSVSHNDGYPASWWPDKPVGHEKNEIYGQTGSCKAIGFTWHFDGVAAFYRTSCDMSGGHSGSPNWTDYPGNNGPYVIGIAMRSECFLCNAAEGVTGDRKTHPSGFRGMTHYLANLITDKRIAFP